MGIQLAWRFPGSVSEGEPATGYRGDSCPYWNTGKNLDLEL